MRMKLIFAALALTMALPAAAEARTVIKRYYFPDTNTAPTALTHKEYDRAHLFARQHGYWRDGGDHAGWTRGDRLPLSLNAPTIDWRTNNLYPPRDGYRWTRVGDDFLLVSRTGRMINEIVLAPARMSGELIAAEPAKKKPYVTTFRPKPVTRPASYYEK